MTSALASAGQFLLRCLDHRSPSRTLVMTIDAPRGVPEAFLASTWHPYGTLWSPHEGLAFATGGVAERIVVHGPDRFAQLKRETARVFSALEAYAYTSAPPPLPRIVGGIAFAPGGAEPPWTEFGDGAFVLPRWTYSVSNENAFLTLAIGANQPRERDVILDELEAIVTGVTKTKLSLWVPSIPTARVEQLELDTWVRMLSEVRGRFESGQLRKVIMARRTSVPIQPKLKDVSMMMRLRREIPECTRFAFRGLHSTFLGATPETLFSKTGQTVRTEALAGSIRCMGTKLASLDEQKLLNSDKDRKEHAIVVDQLAVRLRPLLTAAPHLPAPSTRRFRNIIHLHTPVVAQLSPNVNAADLLERLHPTAAIGGDPVLQAARCIVEVEPCQRGWYAGPVGWIDSNGDALFCVAIRSGLVAHPHAYIYAGAGIVAESDAVAEYSETGLKQMPMLLALGVESATLQATMAPHSVVPPPIA